MTEDIRIYEEEQREDDGHREIYLQGDTDAAPEEALMEEDYDEEGPEPTKRVPKVLKVLVYLAAVLAVSFALAYFAWICAGDVFALSKPDRDVEVVVDADPTVDEITEMLAEKGLIRYKWLFKLYCAVTGAEKKISEGTYTLNNVYDYHALINGLRATAATRETTEVMIPEGYTCAQIFALLEENGVCTAEELENAAASYMFDYTFLQDLPYGDSNRLEGYLFPDTYQFYIDDSPERVLSKFLDNFKWKFTEDLQEEIETLNEKLRKKMTENGFTEEEIEDGMMDLHKIVIVASLIERETGGDSESSNISSVIYNRLTSKIYPLLQIDASLRYGLNNWTEPLTETDLATDNPYNTSKYPGLPAGPISNPGLNSIRAALYPRDSGYYFYVLTSTGFHHFSENYYEHQAYIEEMNQSGS